MPRFTRGRGRGFGQQAAQAASSGGFGPSKGKSKSWDSLFVLDGVEVGASPYTYRNGETAINLVIDPGPEVGRPVFLNYTLAEWLSKNAAKMFADAVEALKDASVGK